MCHEARFSRRDAPERELYLRIYARSARASPIMGLTLANFALEAVGLKS